VPSNVPLPRFCGSRPPAARSSSGKVWRPRTLSERTRCASRSCRLRTASVDVERCGVKGRGFEDLSANLRVAVASGSQAAAGVQADEVQERASACVSRGGTGCKVLPGKVAALCLMLCCRLRSSPQLESRQRSTSSCVAEGDPLHLRLHRGRRRHHRERRLHLAVSRGPCLGCSLRRTRQQAVAVDVISIAKLQFHR